MLGLTPSYLPKQDARIYRVLSLSLYVLFLGLLVYGAMTFLFPYQRYSFDFNNPEATKNNLFESHLGDFSPLEKGKVPAEEHFFVYANNPQVLESGDIIITPSDSIGATHLEGTPVRVHRGWAATFFPLGEELDIPQMNIVEYQGNFYEQRDGLLSPLVSESAAKSWVPADRIRTLDSSLFESTPKSEQLIGFRPGTLLAYADGVFFVTKDATIRPFGSAEVLLRSGYSFDHVLTASGEDVGIYKRGKIILPGELHQEGTLFKDTDTATLYLFQEKKLWPLSEAYGNFLQSQNDIISFSSSSLQQEMTCTLSKKLFQNAYGCQVNLVNLQGMGNDYQISFSAIQETDIHFLQVGLQSSRQPENARATGRSLVIRVLERIGLY